MKNIVLCSDGTGNKGGYGADTNVYKTYKAVKVFNADQYTFYDQGVGTNKSESNKNTVFTAMSGAFGVGFRTNVLHFYHFLARCYDPGDSLFLFGFSRGAATVRAFAGFINACGLLDRNHLCVNPNGNFDEDQFQDRVNQAFECYKLRRKNPRLAQNFKEQYAVRDEKHAPSGNLKIKFIGVWDTVSALGFPRDFSIILSGLGTAAEKLSNEIPWLTHDFYDYELNDSIENAYHALSIDDERKTFHPLIWNEQNFKGHVEQVWFAGVHSNVGGGYPRTGLSDLTLNWMLTKAQAQGLELHPQHSQAIQDGVNVYDKVYDSRDGIAIYYRYGPRNLRQLCNNKLKGNITIHRSAYKKIKEPSEGYAPDGIPPLFDIVDIDEVRPGSSVVIQTINVAVNHGPAWNSLEAKVKKLIDARKCLYRIFVELTMAIIICSGVLWVNQPKAVSELNRCEVNRIQIIQSNPPAGERKLDIKYFVTNPFLAYEQDLGKFTSNNRPDSCKKADDRPLKWFADIIRYVTPSYFENFITYVVEVHPWISIIMLGILFILNRVKNIYVNQLDKVGIQMSDLLP